MAVAFDANATAPTVSNGVTSVTSSALTIGAGSNRAVVAALAWSVTTISAITVNWDQLGTPTAMTLIVSANSTQPTKSSLYGLVNPVSGAKQCKVSWTTTSDCMLNCTSFSGVDQTGGATTFPHSTSTTGTAQVASLVITSATNNHTISTYSEDAQVISSVTNTQTFLNNTGTSVSAAGERAAGAATVTHTVTLSTGTAPWVIVGMDILAAGAAAAFVPYNTYQAPILTQ